MCPTVENLDLVFPVTSDARSATHPRPLKCDSRQTIQAGSDHPDRVVPNSRSLSSDMQPMAPASDRPICHKIQPQVASVCLSSTGLPSCSSGRTYSAMGGPGCICLPTDRHIGQSGGKTTGQPLQENHSNCPGLAQHALVLGLGDHVQSSPSQLAQPARSVDTAFQPDPSPKSDQPKSPCMAPRATAIKEQGFSKAVAARIEAPQRSSTRSVYEAKWTIFTKWCITNQVDFSAHLNEFTARGSWSVPESKLHINYLELKAVFLALKEFQNLCVDKIVLVATDNTTMVAYINKEGGMRSGPLCALLWRILTWCSQRQVMLKARHIPGRLNVIADKLSRLGQTIQTEWSLIPEVFHQICSQWHRPQIDLFATRFNHKLPKFVSPVPDTLAVAVDALTLPWEKLLDSPCKRIILIAPGWPNMPWFWDLVTMSSQVPPSLPNRPDLLTQPFNQIPHRNLTNLNLHAWLLEPQQSKNKASLRQWQQKLRLLKGAQPDQSMRQSGPFLQSGASLIRWTSGLHL